MNTAMWESYLELETCIKTDKRMSYLTHPPVRGARGHVIEIPECHAASTGVCVYGRYGVLRRDGWDINMDHAWA